MMAHFADLLKDQIHLIALGFMAAVYSLRIVWLMNLPAPKETTPSRGNPSLGITYAMLNFAMPWTIQSYRQHWFRYFEFAVFHIGIAVTITANLLIPHWPQIMTPAVTAFCQITIALALAAGVFRFIRRVAVPEMRVISSPDDYFSIIILNIYLVAALFGITYLNNTAATIAFFGMTTFFLIYVPFSKISHYLYYPFNKYFVGKHLGHRGVYPKNYQESQFGCKDA